MGGPYAAAQHVLLDSAVADVVASGVHTYGMLILPDPTKLSQGIVVAVDGDESKMPANYDQRIGVPVHQDLHKRWYALWVPPEVGMFLSSRDHRKLIMTNVVVFYPLSYTIEPGAHSPTEKRARCNIYRVGVVRSPHNTPEEYYKKLSISHPSVMFFSNIDDKSVVVKDANRLLKESFEMIAAHRKSLVRKHENERAQRYKDLSEKTDNKSKRTRLSVNDINDQEDADGDNNSE
jgi:hypothetical protein